MFLASNFFSFSGVLHNKRLEREQYRHSGQTMELDVLIEAQQGRRAVEYQGEQHFYDTRNYGESVVYKQRDEEKAAACARNGVALIEVPYWVPLHQSDGKRVAQVITEPLIQSNKTA